MANSKISKLPVAQPLQDSDLIPVVQTSGTGLETRRTTINSLRSGFSSDRIISNNRTNMILSDNFGLRGITGSYYYAFEFDLNRSVIYNPRNNTRDRLLSFDASNNQFILGERSGSSIIDAQQGSNSIHVRIGLGSSGITALMQTREFFPGQNAWRTNVNEARHNSAFVGSEESESANFATRRVYLRSGGADIIDAFQDLRNSQNNSVSFRVPFGNAVLQANNQNNMTRIQQPGWNGNVFVELSSNQFTAAVSNAHFLHAYHNTGTNTRGAFLCNPSTNLHRIELTGDRTHFGFPSSSRNFAITGFEIVNGAPRIRVSANNGLNYHIPLSI